MMLKIKLKKVLKMMGIGLLVLVLLGVGYVYWLLGQPQFGKLPSEEALKRFEKSPQFKNGVFDNTNPTPALTEGVSYFQVIKEFFFTKKERNVPTQKIPTKKIDLLHLSADEEVFVWFGHSSYFIQKEGIKILVDPVFSGNASPVKFTTKSFAGSDAYTVEDFPEIDYLFISHDHWDHLDYETVLKLKSKVKKVITGLGVGEHFKFWGYDSLKINELDWHEKLDLQENISVTATQGRHFSGRGLKRNTSLWVSFVLKTKNKTLFLGGDSGYDTHFKEIGYKYGPFDLAILECGQYDQKWKYIHMMPEEVVQAGFDLKAVKIIPVHFSKFALANHPWDESIIRYSTEAKNRKQTFIAPFIGEKINLNDSATYESKFWEEVR